MNAAFDQNNVHTVTAGLNTNGTTVIKLQADPTTHRLKVIDGTSGSDFGPIDALRDDNFVPVRQAVSSSDNSTPRILYADSSSKLLIQST